MTKLETAKAVVKYFESHDIMDVSDGACLTSETNIECPCCHCPIQNCYNSSPTKDLEAFKKYIEENSSKEDDQFTEGDMIYVSHDGKNFIDRIFIAKDSHNNCLCVDFGDEQFYLENKRYSLTSWEYGRKKNFKEMTLQEIEELVGFKIKILERKD